MKQNFLLFSLLVLTAFKIEWTNFKIDDNKQENIDNNEQENVQPKIIETQKEKKHVTMKKITTPSNIDETNPITIFPKTESQEDLQKIINESQVKILEEADDQDSAEILDI